MLQLEEVADLSEPMPAVCRFSSLGVRLHGSVVSRLNVLLAVWCKITAVVGLGPDFNSLLDDVDVKRGAGAVLVLLEDCALLGLGVPLIVGLVFPLGGDNVAAGDVVSVVAGVKACLASGSGGGALLFCFVGRTLAAT